MTGRNDPCPCGSGRKYKACCGPGAASAVTAGAAVLRPCDLIAAGAIAAPFAPLQQLMRLRPARFDEAQRAQADPEAARTEAGQLLEQGRVLVQRGQIEGAIGALRVAQRLDPANAAIPRALGLFYL